MAKRQRISELTAPLIDTLTQRLEATAALDAAQFLNASHGIGYDAAEAAWTEGVKDRNYRSAVLATVEGYLRGHFPARKQVVLAKYLPNVIQRVGDGFDECVASKAALAEIKSDVDEAAIAKRYASEIWEQTDKGRKLIQPPAARALLTEWDLCCVEHSATRKQWYKYDPDPGMWVKITTTAVEKMARLILGEYCSISQIKSVVSMAGTMCEVDEQQFFAHEHHLNLANGVYDLETYTLNDHGKQYYFRHVSGYDHDPAATCFLTDAVLRQFSKEDQSWVDAFWEWAGFCLTWEYTWNKMLWLIGDGANGKSTVMNVLKELVGRAETKTGFNVEDLSKDFFLGTTYGKRMALCGDANVRMTNIHLLKQYTGKDTVEANRKFSDYQQFDVTAKLVMAMNRPPLLSSNEVIKPIYRRIFWLPFDYKIERPDPTIEHRIAKEMPGIFNRAIEGLQRLRSNGEFTYVKRGQDALNLWVSQSNAFSAFIADRVMLLTESPGEHSEFLVDIWNAYKDWMRENGGVYWESDPYSVRSSHQLGQELQARYGVMSGDQYDMLNGTNVGRQYKHYQDKEGKWVKGRMVKYFGIALRKNEDSVHSADQEWISSDGYEEERRKSYNPNGINDIYS